jgi:hypothetical protein
MSVSKSDAAFARAGHVWRAERALHLPDEAALQRVVLGHPLVIQAANLYYGIVHGPSILVFLGWLFFRHRTRYPGLRSVLVLATAASLVIQLVPVAPPRLMPSLGFIDTASLYHQSVYPAVGGGISDQLSAMPSVHVAWAVLIGVGVFQLAATPWRWLGVVHLVVTLFVVTATANHFWLDGVAAAVIVAAAFLIDRAGRAAVRKVRADIFVPAEMVILDSA